MYIATERCGMIRTGPAVLSLPVFYHVLAEIYAEYWNNVSNMHRF